MKILDLINTLAAKAGKQNDQAIIDLLSRADLQNIDLADEVANAINNSLLTVDGAKNNPLLKSHFTALALGSADTEILNTIKALELGDEFENEVKGVQNTYEKQRKLSAKLKETVDALKAAKGDGNGKDVEKYTKQINDLNQQISQLKDSTVAKSELDTLKKQHETELINMAVINKLTGLNFANKNIPNNMNVMTAKSLLDNALKGKAVVVRDENGELKLKRANDPALDYYDESQKAISFDDFSNKIFADNKLLTVSGGNPNNAHQQVTIPSGGKIDTTQFAASLNASLGDIQNNN